MPNRAAEIVSLFIVFLYEVGMTWNGEKSKGRADPAPDGGADVSPAGLEDVAR
jgi:hypothetical protein